MAAVRKEQIVTFKVDRALLEAMRGIPNRSEFIRAAVLAAMDSVCPLCKGTGILTPDQRKHWSQFAENHTLEECADCHAVHLVCAASEEAEDARLEIQSAGPQAQRHRDTKQ